MRPHLRGRAGDHVAEVAPVGAGLDRAGLDPREVEQVVDQPRPAVPTRPRSPTASSRAVARPRAASLRRPPAAVVIAVSGERRSCEIACSTAVLATSARRVGLGLGRLRVSALALERDVDQPARAARRSGRRSASCPAGVVARVQPARAAAQSAGARATSPASRRRRGSSSSRAPAAPVASAIVSPRLRSSASRPCAGEHRRGGAAASMLGLALAGGGLARALLGLGGALARRAPPAGRPRPPRSGTRPARRRSRSSRSSAGGAAR